LWTASVTPTSATQKNVLDGFHLVADGLLCLVAIVVGQIGPDVVKHFVFVNDGQVS
jgi:hypothetical protein